VITIIGNPTPMAQAFIEFFSKRHPLKKDVVIEFIDTEFIHSNGMRGNGSCGTSTRGPVQIKIANKIVNPVMGVFMNLKAAAHEYGHALQFNRDKLKYKGKRDRVLENAADDFAYAEIKAAREAGIIVT
jgi:hypothetical protein